MHEKTNPSSLYITNKTKTNNIQGENIDFTSNEENEKEDNKIQQEEYIVAIEFINILTTSLAHDNLIASVSEIHPRYYVNLPTNCIAMN